jgi:hypothetical protein
MFAVDPAVAVGPRVMSKIAHLARTFDAEVELFDCVFDWRAVQAGRIGSVRSDQDIRETVEHSQRARSGRRERGMLRWRECSGGGARLESASRCHVPCGLQEVAHLRILHLIEAPVPLADRIEKLWRLQNDNVVGFFSDKGVRFSRRDRRGDYHRGSAGLSRGA